MNFSKKKITKIIFDCAFKFPFIFPKYIQSHAKSMHSDSDIINSLKEKNKVDKMVSILNHDPYWKSISFSFIFNNSELKNLEKWKIKKASSIMGELSKHAITPQSFDNSSSCDNIGNISINEEGSPNVLYSMYIESSYFKNIHISLIHFSSSLSLISFYIYLDSGVTNLINNVKLPKITEFVELETLNFFNKKRRGVIPHRDYSYANKYIQENMKDVYLEAWKLITFILKEMKVKKNKFESNCIFDFYIDNTPPYFNRQNKNRDVNKYVIIDTHLINKNLIINNNEDDSFIVESGMEEIDMIYIKTHPQSDYDDYDNFKNTYCSNYDSHLHVSILQLIGKKIDFLSNSIERIKPFDEKNKLSKIHKDLFNILYELEIVKNWLKSIKKDNFYYSDYGYQYFFKKSTKNMINRVSHLKEITNSIYLLSENKIQISNLKYNQHYSKIIFILVITQIILAAMTIKWSDNDAWYAPVIIWIKNLIHIF
ncbi:hypothetical protein [Proteus terrae]|uniref:hypothetical protein n=1 Tax=Proteus terrae TaxID=1574161 RepID=UPI001BA4A089|nr:hypothetical protein [Proteus terrae]QUT00495.1 hypothetical protein KF949_11900 [Proteus terrae subsp. cibarius]